MSESETLETGRGKGMSTRDQIYGMCIGWAIVLLTIIAYRLGVIVRLLEPQ